MENLNFNTVYSVMIFVSCALSIYSIIKNNNKDTQQAGIDSGIMENDMKNIKESLDDIKKSVNGLDSKVDEKYGTIEKDFRELLIANTKLEQAYKSLHHRVDEITNELHLNK